MRITLIVDSNMARIDLFVYDVASMQQRLTIILPIVPSRLEVG